MLATFVAKRGDKAVDAWQNAPQKAVDGALVYQASQCGTCHKLNGVGDDVGPPLNGIGERRDRAWIERHFADPPGLSPGSIMPVFAFSPRDLKLITDYITSIPK
jgi:mono/diheme cytochrome c family protein